MEDRFAKIGRRAAFAVLTTVAALMLFGVVQGAHPPGARGGPPGNDSALFIRVVDDLRQSEPYYQAVTREHRVDRYPLHPFITVRLPTLATAMAALPSVTVRSFSIRTLAVLTFLAWLWRLRDRTSAPISFGLTLLGMGASSFAAFLPFSYTLHELWTGELLALALAVYRPRRWVISFAIALVALSIRELAAPFFLAMATLAWRDGRRGEAAAWILGILAFIAALAAHAALLQPFVRPDDRASPGWLGLAGWKFLLLQMKWNALLMTAPDWVAAILAPLAILGLVARRGQIHDRVLLVVLGYMSAFLIVGRPDNAYWGLIIAPLWPIGILTAWPAVRELVANAT
jgi:hypothetical protein